MSGENADADCLSEADPRGYQARPADASDPIQKHQGASAGADPLDRAPDRLQFSLAVNQELVRISGIGGDAIEQHLAPKRFHLVAARPGSCYAVTPNPGPR